MILLAALMLSLPTDCGAEASEAQLMVCASAELSEAEKALAVGLALAIDNARLNDENSSAGPRDPSREARVREAQVAWLAYREAQCDAQYLAPVARRLEEVNKVWCRTRLTKERTAELTRFFIVD